jgi:hypothetical protein
LIWFSLYIRFIGTLTIEANAGRQGKLTILVGMDAMGYELPPSPAL